MPDTCYMPTHTLMWSQLLSVGLLWVTLHCSGMCGPIVTGLLVHHTRPFATASPRSVLRCRIQGVLAYQMGRAVVYALLGAIAGEMGATVEGTFAHGAKVVATVCAMGFVAMTWRSWQGTSPGAKGQLRWARKLGWVMAKVSRWAPQPGCVRMGLFGLIMGGLPCMVMMWVLGLAVGSGNPVHGALLMVSLVVMTTPMMLAVASSVTWIGQRLGPKVRRLVPVLMTVSAAWMVCVALAAWELIAHQSVSFTFLSKPYALMFW